MCHSLHVLLQTTKPYNNIFFVFFEYFDLHGEHSEDLNLYSDMENQTIFHIFHFSFRRRRPRSARRNREKIVEFIFVTSEEGTLFDIDWRSLVWFCLSMLMASNVLKAFRTGVAKRS